jgi:hypothetical protein
MSAQLQILIAVVGLSVSIFAFWNSYQARKENRTNVLFRLKIEALTLAHEVEALWQSVIDELENAQQRIHKSANTHPAVQSILVALSDWEDTFRKAKALAGKIANDCDKGFDGGLLRMRRMF